mgnify:CR=1 FL=1
MPITCISVEEAVRRHDELVSRYGRAPGLLSEATLEHILERVREHEGDIFDRAALLLRATAVWHPFMDGNKRTAFYLAVRLLKLNGYELAGETSEIVSFMLSVARGDKSIKDVRQWLRQHSREKAVLHGRGKPSPRRQGELDEVDEQILADFDEVFRELAKH